MRRLLVGSLLLTLVGCDALRDAFSGRVDAAARADRQVLTVDRLAEWAGHGKQVPLQQEALYRLCKVWIDYTLFADAVAADRPLGDSAMVAAAMWPLFSQLKWDRFHERIAAARPEFTPQQVDSAYAAGKARLFQHILLQVPPSAPPDVAEQKRRTIDDLRRQIAARRGVNFTELATQHSEDPGSKERGGFLGVSEIEDPFVQEFKDAAWALAPGELSPVIRTAFGFHIIRRPPVAEVRDIFRFGLADRIGAHADSLLVDSLTRARDFELATGALEAAREAVQDLDVVRASDKILVRFRGGSFRVKDLVRWLYSLEPQTAQAIATAPRERLEQFLRLVAQRHVLLVLADSAGIEPSPDEWQFAKAQHDSAVSLLRNALRLTPDVLRDSAATADDRHRLATARVEEYLDRVVAGRAQFLPMPPFFSWALREAASWDIDQAGVRLALERGRTLRAARDSAAGPPPALQPAPGPAPTPGQ
jgi:hypothetical protein